VFKGSCQSRFKEDHSTTSGNTLERFPCQNLAAWGDRVTFVIFAISCSRATENVSVQPLVFSDEPSSAQGVLKGTILCSWAECLLINGLFRKSHIFAC
jgi:hypothetical protein